MTAIRKNRTTLPAGAGPVETGAERPSETRVPETRVLVTGASSGIGAALAERLARDGRRLLLWGRNEARLAAVAARCRVAGAGAVDTRVLDLADPRNALRALDADDAAGAIGLAVLAAGLGDMRRTGEQTEDPELVLELALVNAAAPMAMAAALARRMVDRGGGRIVLVGSVAAFHDLPYAAAYSGSKAGLSRFASALDLGLHGTGVGVTLVSPGFVDTPMSRRLRSVKPFLMTADAAAERIARAAERGERHLMLPWPFRVAGALSAVVPPPLRRRIMRSTRAEQAARDDRS
ncbi:MAG: SDR family NAD(P)-dependent oxidoreductase [Gluconacetobacter diazotrophicus]|nr:SDR family NAD(P)-dependent oxidoreductase [Gluconacetobacter diazotrophicus]